MSYYKDIERRQQTVRRCKERSKTRLQQYVLDYLKSHPCVDCGETDPVVLDFDHRNPEEKTSAVSRIVSDRGALSRLEEEISKCDVRCANCHRKRHIREDEKQGYITKQSFPCRMTPEAREKIRQSKLGKSPSVETRAKISASLQGNTCRKIQDLTGKVFGRLTVLRQGDKLKRRIHWWCQCSCGSPEKQISGIKMTTGRTNSCGCLRKEFHGNQFSTDKIMDKESLVPNS